jgi:hypothetical protein
VITRLPGESHSARYSSRTLETVNHHLKPPRQPSVGPRHLLAELHAAGVLGWSRVVIDGSHLRAMKGGPKPDRARSAVPELARNIT